MLEKILIALSLTLATKSEEYGVFFEVEEDHFLVSDGFILKAKEGSLLSCSQLCAKRENCKSANFVTEQGTCSLLDKRQTENAERFFELKGSIYLEKVESTGSITSLGTTQSSAVPSCQFLLIQFPSSPSGVYWIDPDGGSQENAFKAYCDMETNGGGWVLVWSYTFTNYQNFKHPSNAITPRPNWPANSAVNVPISTTAPLGETDYNAIHFSLWKQLGRQVLIKSNINNWLICHPGTGSLVDWQDGDVRCHVVKHVTNTCKQSSPGPTDITISNTGSSYGPMFWNRKKKSGIFYYFDGSKGSDWPAHDPCGTNNENNLKNVVNPRGNIFIRR